MSLASELSRLIPEIVVSVMACVILVADQTRLERIRNLPFALTLLTLLVVCALTASQVYRESATVVEGMFADDAFATVTKFMICLLGVAVFVYSRSYSEQRDIARSEYYVLGLFGILGMMIMSSADHLLVLYLGLELMSLCLYAMIAFQRDSALATEAAMKYFVLGAIGSGSLLYGLSILYGLTGSLDISIIHATLVDSSEQNLPLIFALVFVVTAIAFKLGAAPFHMWVPDVYHGAPTATTVYLGSMPKIAAFAMLMRLLIGGLESLAPIWQDMFIIIALLSIAVGNLIAIAQTNLKRMFAYSTIAHMGFMLLGILSGSQEGYTASLFYVLVYAVMSLGAFGIIVISASKGDESDLIKDYSGLNARDPWMAFWLLLLMFSLAGVPPTVGFYAKLAVIQALVDANLVWVAVIAVLLAVVGAFYYLRIIKVVYFDDISEQPIDFDRTAHTRVLLGFNAIVLVAILPWVGSAIAICQQAILSLG
ncbi:MAG: NADH-quinone oxidoreductase subunit NuoN [Acidiferrobacterales bacterium]|nr:NADH-quinone oxidoreductase subunit NuoN [Acidiferrobacterales bacterium]